MVIFELMLSDENVALIEGQNSIINQIPTVVSNSVESSAS